MPFPASHPALDLALIEQGYLEPTPVQAAVLEAGAHDRDLLVSAQTGSGKTVAFGLALASTLLGDAERLPPVVPQDAGGAPSVLVVAPTRELALQVSRELTWLYGKAGAEIVTCVGGMDPRRERRDMSAGCHIVVGTPGRLCDHLSRGNLDLSALKAIVLDEADEMLDLGFREDLEILLDAAPAQRRTLLFSATIAKDIAALARRYQNDALRIDTISRNEPHGDIDYRAIRVAPNEVENAVVNVLRFYEVGGALVFCATREAVRHLFAFLRERGFAVVALSGELSQKERSDALQALRDGHAKVCVATDVAARGLDLPDLGLVVHAELPQNRAALLHRSGRTGRAGRKGVSVLLVPYPRRRKAEQLLTSANIEATWGGPPSAEQIRVLDQRRLLDDPMLTEAASEEDLVLARSLLADRDAEQIAAALIRLHRARLPEPEELFDAPQPAERERREPRETHKAYDREQGGRERAPREAGERAHNDYVMNDETVWFRLPIGRGANADPKWLIPLICRQGHVTKKDIGQIRIFDRETKFEISREAEARFLAAVQAGTDDNMRIEPAAAPSGRGAPSRGGPPSGPRGPRGPRPDAPRADAPRFDKPRAEPARSDAPRPERPKREPSKPYAPEADAQVRDVAPAPYQPKPRPGGKPFGKPPGAAYAGKPAGGKPAKGARKPPGRKANGKPPRDR